MIVLVGGSGFKGLAVARKLREIKVPFRILDRRRPRGFTRQFKRADTRNYKSVRNRVSRGDILIHTAFLSDTHESLEENEKYFDTNVKGTLNVVRACRERGCGKLVFESSVAVYDSRIRGTVTEKSRVDPDSFHALTKVMGENLVRMSDTPHVILRLSNVYGPGGRGVINSFVNSVKRRKKVEIWGSGNQKRDFIHINDVVDAFLAATKRGEGTYNISNGKAYGIREIFKKINKITGHSDFTFRPSGEKFIGHGVSNTRAARDLKFRPRIGLDKGIRMMIGDVMK